MNDDLALPRRLRYTPRNWFWLVAGQVYSSTRAAYVKADDAQYAAWIAAGGLATSIASEAALCEVFISAGLPQLRPRTLQDKRADLIASIDADVDAIRAAVLGSRTTEYQAAYTDALAFQAAGYSGTVPPGVKSWLDAKTAVGAGWSARQCADDILAVATSWMAAEGALRSQRLLRKEQARVAEDAALAAVQAAWNAFTSHIKNQLGIAG